MGSPFQKVFAVGDGAQWKQTCISAHAPLIKAVHCLVKAIFHFSSNHNTSVLAAVFPSEQPSLS